ncbi:MAG: ATP-binding protein, partial [Gammaproteobacteria bacterium]|nr:ATP-binding protein [Gammaproteobacteria bacterium]
IQQLAADWSIETARVRSDPLADFDSLAAFIPRMDQLKQVLLATIRGIPDIPNRLANDVSAYVNAVEAREERIERFKTGYAIIRNSARYLPLAASNIVQSTNVDADLSREVSALTNDINGYLTAPSDAVKGRLTVALERLADQAEDLQPPLPDHVANFIAHADVLLAQQAPTGELFSQATSSEISDLSAQLVEDLGFELTRKNQLSSYYVNGMLGAAGVLLLVWIVAGAIRLRAASAPAPSASTEVLAAGQAAERDATTPSGDATHAASGDAWAATKLLMSHRILADSVASRLAETAREISESLETLREVRGDFNGARAANGDTLQPVVEQGAQTLSQVRERIGAITDMADRLSAFSKGQSDVSYTLLDLNDCVREVVDDTRAETGAEVTVEKGAVPEIFASKAEICLMLEKVVENSLQAIADSDRAQGELRISTGADADRASVTIIDNGVGMTPQTRARMFDPFFAEQENRTGVGLISTSHLVGKYGGTISVSSMPGGGTVTRIQLPGMADR